MKRLFIAFNEGNLHVVTAPFRAFMKSKPSVILKAYSTSVSGFSAAQFISPLKKVESRGKRY
jgi:hypothetical protein